MTQERIFVSSYNFDKEIVKNEHLQQKIIINDVTLREEHLLPIELSQSQKVEIATKLDDLGVNQLQTASREARELIPAIKKAGVKAGIEVLARPGGDPTLFHPAEYGYSSWQEEIDACVESGADVVTLVLNLKRMLANKWPKEKALERVVEVIEYTKSKGAKCIGFHTSMTTWTGGYLTLDFYKQVYQMAAGCGVQRIGWVDTEGFTKPLVMKWLIEEIKKAIGLPIHVHCHNDFGLATANTLACAEGGATILDVSINGLDRAAGGGCATLDEVVMSLLCLYRKDVGIKTEKLCETARYFEKVTGQPLALRKPITGADVWGVERDHVLPHYIEGKGHVAAFDLSLIGHEKLKINLTRGIGEVGIRYKLGELNLSVPEDRVMELVEVVTAESVKKHRGLTDEEFVDLAKKLS